MTEAAPDPDRSRSDHASSKTDAFFEIVLILGIFGSQFFFDLQGGAVLAALAVAVASLWLRRGFRRPIGLAVPRRWPFLIVLAIALAAALQAGFVVALEPFLREATGAPVDLSQFDAIRGNLPRFLVALALAWSLAAFGEELCSGAI